MNEDYRWHYEEAARAVSTPGQLTIINPYSGEIEDLNLIEHRPDYIRLKSGKVSVMIINRPLVKNSGRLF